MNRVILSIAVLASLLISPRAQFEGQSRQTGTWANILSSLRPRSLGPTNMGGRIMDIAVYGPRPQVFYVATASGGLWKTENAGTTVRPVFQNESSVSLGATAVSQKDPNLVWV